MTLKRIVAPSILSANFAALGEDIDKIIDAGADWLHVDVMDGHFVPNISIGFPVIKGIRRHLTSNPKNQRTFLDVHIMVSDPKKWVDTLHDLGVNQVTFHAEAVYFGDITDVARAYKSKGMRVGLAFKPGTELSRYMDLMTAKPRLFDMALVMTVEPGFGGQKFMNVLHKVKALRSAVPEMDIQVDGGINEEFARLSAEAGANVMVAGSSIFGAPDWAKAIKDMREAVDQGMRGEVERI